MLGFKLSTEWRSAMLRFQPSIVIPWSVTTYVPCGIGMPGDNVRQGIGMPETQDKAYNAECDMNVTNDPPPRAS